MSFYNLTLLLKHWLALRAIPFSFGFAVEVHAPEVEPLYGAVLIVAADHFTVGNLLA